MTTKARLRHIQILTEKAEKFYAKAISETDHIHKLIGPLLDESVELSHVFFAPNGSVEVGLVNPDCGATVHSLRLILQEYGTDEIKEVLNDYVQKV